MSVRNLCIVHENRAPYPERQAYRDYFSPEFEVSEMKRPGVSQSDKFDVYWHLMGFYPQRPSNGLIIHDYRSLSVGSFNRVKDLLKRHFNSKPDIRIFQNDEIRKYMGFNLEKNTYFLPMGIPEIFFKCQPQEIYSKTVDFIYAGSMIEDRRCELMIDSFIKRFGQKKTFDLYGPLNNTLITKYKEYSNISFRGILPANELGQALRNARVAVNYFPNWFPHIIQTPTKLIEYAALGMKIVSNEQKSSRLISKSHGIRCLWGPNEHMFEFVPDNLDWIDNSDVNLDHLTWSGVIRDSGVPDALRRMIS